MKISFLFFFTITTVIVYAQKNSSGTLPADTVLNTVSDLAILSKAGTNSIQIKDTIRGGTFYQYNGTDSVDNGMIFLDGSGRKWLRKVNGDAMRLSWYGLNPYNNYANDDAPKIRAAINYVHKHKSIFNRKIYFPSGKTDSNSWYLIGSTITLQDIEIIGDGLQENPVTNFQVLPDVTAFYIPALDQTGNSNHVNVTNIQITHYDPATPARNHHSFDIRCFVNFYNVKVSRNFNGNGFNIIACGGVTDNTFGNADHSNFLYCQGIYCENGMHIEGCDANIMNIMNCSWVLNRYWGVYDNGLLGNVYYNNHFSANGKQGNSVVTFNGHWYVSEDSANNIGKRPDLHPEYWHEVVGMSGANPWDGNKHYYSGGTLAVVNVNAYTKVIAPYTESFQPPMILNLRSTSEGGDNDAGVRGGLNIHPVGGMLYIDNDKHEGGLAADKLYVGPTPVGNTTIYAETKDFYALTLNSTGKSSVVQKMKNNSGSGDGGFEYKDTVLSILADGNYALSVSRRSIYPYGDGVDLGKRNTRFKDVYIGGNYYGTTIGLNSTVEGVNPTISLGSSSAYDKNGQLFVKGNNAEQHILSGANGVGYFGTVGTSHNMAFSIGNGAAPTSTLQSYGSFSLNTVSTAVDYTAGHYDANILITAPGKTVTLPTAVGIQGRQYTIKLTATGSGRVITTLNQSIDGSATYNLASRYKYVTVVSDNANWNIIANN